MAQILIIDDSRLVQARLSDILSPDYRLSFADDGPCGIAAFLKEPPDLVLLDIHLPGMDGYEVCRQLKGEPGGAKIPVIFITSMGSEQEKVVGFEAGADDYIVKPFYPEELRARIKLHLGSRRAAEQEIELERLKLFREMAVALSHEINNPLTAVYGCLYILEKENNDKSEELNYSLRGIKKELERIRDIVKRFSDASRTATISYDSSTNMIDLHGI